MRIAVIGLGSMGRRRLRNLRSLGVENISGYDSDQSRANEVSAEFEIEVLPDIESSISDGVFDAVVISTSPDWHMHYAELCVNAKIPVFIEASVVETERVGELAALATDLGVLVAPSCTMRFFEGPRLVKQFLAEGKIGKPLLFTYHTGQWLEDWHPWESIEDYYVSERKMGGGREIVPFELTWLNDIFGSPEVIAASRAKLSDLQADIDDYYSVLFSYDQGVKGCMTVEVLSRPVNTRELRIIGTEGILKFSADSNSVQVSNTESPGWETIQLDSGTKVTGAINPDEPYREELEAFLKAVSGGGAFPNTLREDYEVLQILDQVDKVSER